MRAPTHTRRRLSCLAPLALLVLVLAAPARALAAPDSATVLSWLSGQRERNGIPGALAERADWSADCAAHMAYVAQNGGVLTHVETPGAPGYTADGAWAGKNSVLTTGTWTTADHDPFENAPVHLAQMLAPALAESGASNGSGLCITTWPGYDRPAPAATTIYTYPGPGTTIYPSQTVRESPITPQAALGLPETGNGPTIYAFGVAPTGGYYGQPKLVSASLTGPGGAVPLATTDWASNTAFAAALPAGTALVIPTKPLQTGASYTATVTMRASADPQDTTRTWSFITGAVTQALPGGTLPAGASAPASSTSSSTGTVAPAAPATGAPAASGAAHALATLAGSVRRLDARHVRVRLRFAAASVGLRARIAAIGRGGRVTGVGVRRVRARSAILHLRVPPDTVSLRVVVPGAAVLRLNVHA
ncbi:MAG TPA: hypothetical protein VMT10_09955 [Solirubrobacteraceae bacterium]|nr:hypothetical protein [Solirubrobacteraceae bacterium]